MPAPVARQMRMAIGERRKQPAKAARWDVLRTLSEGWAASRVVAIQYRSSGSHTSIATELEPHLIEPSGPSHALYVIGFSRAHRAIRTFKVDRIVEAELTTRAFEAPDPAELLRRLDESWGVIYGEDHRHVVLEFKPSVAEHVSETKWHPSQRLTWLPSGALRAEFQLPSLVEFTPWVRSWGSGVRVIEPDELKREVARSLEQAAGQYRDLRTLS
jgi:proteasome accessory factor B